EPPRPVIVAVGCFVAVDEDPVAAAHFSEIKVQRVRRVRRQPHRSAVPAGSLRELVALRLPVQSGPDRPPAWPRSPRSLPMLFHTDVIRITGEAPTGR